MIRFGEKDIEEMNVNQLKDLHDKMLMDYYSSSDFYDFGTENMLGKLSDEIKKKEVINNSLSKSHDETTKYQIMGDI